MPKGIYQHKPQQGFQKGHTDFSTIQSRKKISKALIGHSGYWKDKKRPIGQVLNGIEKRKGENHWNWRGGISIFTKTIRQLAMQTFEYRNWRKSVFERDGHICVFCGIKSEKSKKVYLNADHIKSWIKYPELRYELSNGRTLCVECHRKTNTWGIKALTI